MKKDFMIVIKYIEWHKFPNSRSLNIFKLNNKQKELEAKMLDSSYDITNHLDINLMNYKMYPSKMG